MYRIKISLITCAALLVFIAGCSLDAPTEKQTVLKPGTADFSRYVSLGNSITAGYQSAALTEKHQKYSYANLLAEQMGVETFVQPLLGYPGIGNYSTSGMGIIELTMLQNPATGMPVLTPASYASYPNFNPLLPYASADIANYAAPYNNLGVPGAVTYDIMNATSSATSASGNNPFFDIILRNPAFNNTTAFQQARMLQPTFITCWIGNNDVLGYATSGGTSPVAPTPVPTFTALYTVMLDSLCSLPEDPTAVVLANIPDVTTIPYFTTIPYMVAVPGVGNVALVIATGAGVRQATAADLILLPASSVIGDTTGTYGPHGVPVGLNAAAPLPNSLVLDSDEVAIAQTAVNNFNSVIRDLAEGRNLWVVDVYGVLNDIKENGYSAGGLDFSSDFITGGIFSLDGVHPADIGHAIIANEFINVINLEFSATIPPVNIADLATKVSTKMRAGDVKIPGPEAFKAVIQACGGMLE
jgi:hypothetical protein